MTTPVFLIRRETDPHDNMFHTLYDRHTLPGGWELAVIREELFDSHTSEFDRVVNLEVSESFQRVVGVLEDTYMEFPDELAGAFYETPTSMTFFLHLLGFVYDNGKDGGAEGWWSSYHKGDDRPFLIGGVEDVILHMLLGRTTIPTQHKVVDDVRFLMESIARFLGQCDGNPVNGSFQGDRTVLIEHRHELSKETIYNEVEHLSGAYYFMSFALEHSDVIEFLTGPDRATLTNKGWILSFMVNLLLQQYKEPPTLES